MPLTITEVEPNPVLQWLVWNGWFRGAPFTSLLLACAVILAAAVVLWHLVERRFLLRSSHYVEMTKIPPAGR